MKSLLEYIAHYNQVINGNDKDNFILADKRDKILVQFEYKGEQVDRYITYDDINYTSEAEQWTSEIKSTEYKDITYSISGDYTETGRFGISTINCQVWVKRGNDVIDKIIPKVGITSYTSPVYGNTRDEII